MRRTWTPHFEQLVGGAMTTQHGEAVKQHEAVELTKEEKEAKERESHAEKLRAKARAEEEKRRKEEAELAAKETVKGKILRLVGALRKGVVGTERKRGLEELEGGGGGGRGGARRGGVGTERKRVREELEGAVGRLKSEQLMGELTPDEEKEKKEREKAEREAKAAEEKAAKAGGCDGRRVSCIDP